MSEQNPYQKLGVAESSSFDEIQSAKNRLIEQVSGDSQAIEAIEAAYDAVIMDRLKMRQEGRIKVPDRIRFPERTLEKPNTPAALPAPASPSWLQNSLDRPTSRDLVIQGAVFGGLAGLAVLAVGEQASMLPTLLVLGIFASVYFLNRKERRFGRSLLISLASLFIGVGCGVLASQFVPNLPVSGEQLSCWFSFFLLWLASSFLR
jgi:hypothetical protein